MVKERGYLVEDRLVRTAAADPARGLARDFSLLVEQKQKGTGGFDFLGQIISQRQWHQRLLVARR